MPPGCSRSKSRAAEISSSRFAIRSSPDAVGLGAERPGRGSRSVRAGFRITTSAVVIAQARSTRRSGGRSHATTASALSFRPGTFAASLAIASIGRFKASPRVPSRWSSARLTDPPRRDVHHPAERDVVLRVPHQVEVGEDVLDLLTLVIRQAADDLIRDLRLSRNACSRTRVSAVTPDRRRRSRDSSRTSPAVNAARRFSRRPPRASSVSLA